MSLFTALDVSKSGLAAQRLRVEMLAQNIANAETTRAPEGGPYRRRQVIFEATPAGEPFSAVFGRVTAVGFADRETQGVRVAEVAIDDSEPELRYLPGHPDADAEGFVAFPPFNPVEDMVDLTAGVRAYQANLAVIAALKEMVNRTIEMMR